MKLIPLNKFFEDSFVENSFKKIEDDLEKKIIHIETDGGYLESGDGGLYPETGPGFHKLTQEEFKAFKIFNQLGVSSISEGYAAQLNNVTSKFPELYNGL